MELWVVVAAGGREREVGVTLTPAHTVGDLSAALANHVGMLPRGLFVDTASGSRALDDEDPVGAVGLAIGSVLRWSPVEVASAEWEVAVVGGPDAGRVFPLPADGGVLGRGQAADLVVDDPFVSRQHVRLVPGSEGVAVEDLGSANGTLVSGRPVPAGHVVGDELLELGSTLVAVRTAERARGAPAVVDANGHIVVSDPLALADDRQDVPDLPRLIESARARARPLWSRGATRPLTVRIGWTSEPDGGAGPLHLDLGGGRTVIDAATAAPLGHAVATSAVVQLATLHPPSTLRVLAAVADDHLPLWEWIHWLPHSGAAGLAVGAGEAAASLRALAPPTDDRRLLVVVDLSLPNAPALLEGLGSQPALAVLAIAAPGSPAPSADHRVEVDGETGAVRIDGAVDGLGVDGIAVETARGAARALAPLRETPAARMEAGARVELREVLVATDPGGIAAAWAAQRPRVALVGVGEDGPIGLDLLLNPNVVIPGGEATTRAEIVATMAASLAAGVGPDRLGMVVLDTVGALAPLADLPHALQALSDPEALVEVLRIEVERRGAILAASGESSWAAWRARGDVVPPPLLVVVHAHGRRVDPVLSWVTAEGGLDELGLSFVWSVDAPLSEVLGEGHGTVEPTAAEMATVVRRDGTQADVVIPHRTVEANERASVVVDDLVQGRPSRTAGHTSLQRRSGLRDHLTELVQACVEAAGVSGMPRTTWTPAPETFEHGRVRRTFVFTDIVGSTALVEVIGDAAWTDLVTWHDRALREEFDAHGGEEVDHAGDGFLVAFERPGDAVACAIAVQRRLASHRAGTGFAPRVRIGGHVAEVVRHDGYKGHGLHIAARVGALADGDEIVFSATTIDQLRPPPRTVNSRVVEVKGASAPIEVLEVDWR